jgi:hypothetical protein
MIESFRKCIRVAAIAAVISGEDDRLRAQPFSQSDG